MKRINTLSLLLVIMMMTGTHTHAQRFQLSAPPVNGWFYMDTTDCHNKAVSCVSAKCLDVICENNTVIASGNGMVLYCEPRSNRTYEIAIKYGSSIIVYNNIANKKVQRRQMIKANAEIGDIPMNPKDSRYHLGLQVAQSNAPNRFLWYDPLLSYFNAALVTN